MFVVSLYRLSLPARLKLTVLQDMLDYMEGSVDVNAWNSLHTMFSTAVVSEDCGLNLLTIQTDEVQWGISPVKLPASFFICLKSTLRECTLKSDRKTNSLKLKLMFCSRILQKIRFHWILNRYLRQWSSCVLILYSVSFHVMDYFFSVVASHCSTSSPVDPGHTRQGE